MKEFLLTIAIPTYNRAQYLDLCLAQICKQLKSFNNLVELIVSNNNSTDNTEEIVNKYIRQGIYIKYIRNKINIGPDRNIAQCFKEALGKYVLIMGDDDVLLEGSLVKILHVISNGEYGIVYLNSYGFKYNYENERPLQTINSINIYDDKKEFINRVNYWFTFLTGNVCNKSLVRDNVNLYAFENTSINQLSWIFTAMLSSKYNVVINEYLVASKTYNSSGYKFCQVFGTNMNKIMQFFVEKGFPQESITNINRKLMISFFPFHIVNIRADKENFYNEEFFNELYPVYKSYIIFWLVNVPVIYLPLSLALIWLFPIRILNNPGKALNKLKKLIMSCMDFMLL